MNKFKQICEAILKSGGGINEINKLKELYDEAYSEFPHLKNGFATNEKALQKYVEYVLGDFDHNDKKEVQYSIEEYQDKLKSLEEDMKTLDSVLKNIKEEITEGYNLAQKVLPKAITYLKEIK